MNQEHETLEAEMTDEQDDSEVVYPVTVKGDQMDEDQLRRDFEEFVELSANDYPEIIDAKGRRCFVTCSVSVDWVELEEE